DMLAWIHQTVANEREFLDLLDLDIDGTCRPLKFLILMPPPVVKETV
ncbi:19145_t:CDS:2, partial [Gigaspora margarita]